MDQPGHYYWIDEEGREKWVPGVPRMINITIPHHGRVVKDFFIWVDNISTALNVADDIIAKHFPGDFDVVGLRANLADEILRSVSVERRLQQDPAAAVAAPPPTTGGGGEGGFGFKPVMATTAQGSKHMSLLSLKESPRSAAEQHVVQAVAQKVDERQAEALRRSPSDPQLNRTPERPLRSTLTSSSTPRGSVQSSPDGGAATNDELPRKKRGEEGMPSEVTLKLESKPAVPTARGARIKVPVPCSHAQLMDLVAAELRVPLSDIRGVVVVENMRELPLPQSAEDGLIRFAARSCICAHLPEPIAVAPAATTISSSTTTTPAAPAAAAPDIITDATRQALLLLQLPELYGAGSSGSSRTSSPPRSAGSTGSPQHARRSVATLSDLHARGSEEHMAVRHPGAPLKINWEELVCKVAHSGACPLDQFKATIQESVTEALQHKRPALSLVGSMHLEKLVQEWFRCHELGTVVLSIFPHVELTYDERAHLFRVHDTHSRGGFAGEGRSLR